MARINWEDSIYKHPMYPKLLLKVGCEYKTKGLLLSAFELAQVYWLKHKAVPSNKWPEDMNILIEFTFAEVQKRDDGVYLYVSGSKEHCGFLDSKSENGKKGGAKGGRSKSPKKLQNLKQNRKRTESEPKAPESEPKDSYSYSISISNSSSSTDSDSSTDSVNTPLGQKTKSFIAGYCERFEFKYGSRPHIQGKDAGIAKRVAKDLSKEKLLFYLDAYFAMPDAGVVKAKHPLNLFELKMNEIVVFANTGNFTTQRQAHQADDMASNQLLLEKIRRNAV